MSAERESLFTDPFRVVTDGARYLAIVELDEMTAKRAARLLAEGDVELPSVVANALNLHALPGLIARAKL